jgi:hypothetical protein
MLFRSKVIHTLNLLRNLKNGIHYMANANDYGGVIWTNHVLERIDQRGLTKDIVLQTYRHPDHSVPGKQPGTIEYTRRFQSSVVTVIAKKNDRAEWLLLSAWIDPPLPGTADAKKKQEWRKYQKASLLGKIWMQVLRLLGIKDF